jgi:hypothetical protein
MKTWSIQIKEVVLNRKISLPKALQELLFSFRGTKPGGFPPGFFISILPHTSYVFLTYLTTTRSSTLMFS